MKHLFKSVLRHANKTSLLYDKLWISTRKPVPQGTAQHGIAVDRFAREILAFLNSFCAARSRQLNANPLGRASMTLFISG